VAFAKRSQSALAATTAAAQVKKQLDAGVAALEAKLTAKDAAGLAALQHAAALAVKAVEDAVAANDPSLNDAVEAVSKAHNDTIEAAKPTTPPPTPRPTEGTKPPTTTWLSKVVRTLCILEGINLAEFTTAAQDGVRVAFARLAGVHRSQVALSELAARPSLTHAGAVQFHITIEGTLQALRGPVIHIKSAMAAPASFRTLLQHQMATSLTAAGGDANAAAGAKITIEAPPYLGNNTPPPTPAPTPPPTPAPTPAKPLVWAPCDHVTCSVHNVSVVSTHGSSTHTTITVAHHHLDHSNEHKCALRKMPRRCECMCRGLHGEITYDVVHK
jgi:hypothetical protein